MILTQRPSWIRLAANGATAVAVLAAAGVGCGCPPESVTRRHLSDADLARLAPTGETRLPREVCAVECLVGDPLFTPDATPYDFRAPPTCGIDRSPLPQLVCSFEQFCPGGRRPYGRQGRRARRGATVADLARHMARSEWASVLAFEELALALEEAAATDDLVRRARVAADDERRHARLLARLVTARGGREPRFVEQRPRRRPLDALVELNATEGCVREAYGALVAAHQAVHARDEDVRATFAEVFVDEARHAEFSMDLHAHVLAHASPRRRRHLAASRMQAARRLRIEVDAAMPRTWAREFGIPERETAGVLADAVFG